MARSRRFSSRCGIYDLQLAFNSTNHSMKKVKTILPASTLLMSTLRLYRRTIRLSRQPPVESRSSLNQSTYLPVATTWSRKFPRRSIRKLGSRRSMPPSKSQQASYDPRHQSGTRFNLPRRSQSTQMSHLNLCCRQSKRRCMSSIHNTQCQRRTSRRKK